MYHILALTAIIYTTNGIDDFRVGIQLCDGRQTCAATGNPRFTPFLSNGGGASSWAGDSNYYDPDGVKIGLEGRSIGQTNSFKLENVDIKLCIQATDDASNENGNLSQQGVEQCTPWASAGGGWSDWAGDSNFGDFDALRVILRTQGFDGLVITDVQAGIRLTDDGTSSSKMGVPQYTNWLDGSGLTTASWSPIAGDSNYYDPDSVKIYLGVQKYWDP